MKINPRPQHYWAENKTTLDSYIGPVMVSVLKRTRPAPDLLEAEALKLTKVFAGVLDRPEENVHIKYESDAVGRVMYGCKMVN
ncbi:hypothetical protein F7C95_16460 [Opitutia bacterium ISCC 51]|nr:hypothetical protein F7C95_16460 [Opitutae bacterium ISCC 51]QXD27570.1 hypothetical protein GA003_16360 [Opitutae bacterium ISCC 52]